MLALLLAVPSVYHVHSYAQRATLANGVRLLRADTQHALLELTAPQYHLAPSTVASGTWDQLMVPGADATTEPGEPALPLMGAVLGVPPAAQVALRVVSDDAVALDGHFRILPAPHAERRSDDFEAPIWLHEPDAAAYAATKPYPSAVARVADDGWLRDQRVIQVTFAPFQYTPTTGKLLWHRRMLVEVRWATPDMQPTVPPQTVWEPALHTTLLNYSVARAWRVAPPPPARPAVAGTAAVPSATPAPPIKIVVDHDGLYRLTHAELVAAGFDAATTDPQTLGMTSQGQPVAIEVVDGGDGRFDPGDSIHFYGQRYQRTTQPDTIVLNGTVVTTNTVMSRDFEAPTFYTDDNVYWLSAGGSAGPRMAAVDATPTDTAPVPASYRAIVRAEESTRRWTWHFTSRDIWFWDRIEGSVPLTRTYPTILSALAPSGPPAVVRGELVARNGQSGGAPDHRSRLMLNDAQVVLEDATWDGKRRYRFERQTPQATLREGSNQLLLHLTPQQAVPSIDMYFDWYAIEYSRRFAAEADQLQFPGEGSGTYQYTVAGYSSAAIAVYDVSTPLLPRRLTNVRHTTTSDEHQVTFQATHTAGAQLLAVAAPALQSAKQITRPLGADLRSAANSADYLVITHRDFLAGSQRLANYHATHGLRTMVVDVADIYNQFNAGIYNPLAIKQFLAYAYVNWQQPAPSYAVLVGDGHWNFKQRGVPLYGAPPIYMPPMLGWVDPYEGLVDATNILAAVVGNDILPDLAIGRMPVNSPAELDAIVDKTIGYAQAPAQPWQRRLLFIADNGPDSAGNFEQLTDAFIDDHLPEGYTADRINMNDPKLCGPKGAQALCPAVNAAIAQTLNITGTLIVNYTGHGAIDRWTQERAWVNADIAQLTNGDRLPIILSLDCLDGYWMYPNIFGLVEEMVRAPNRGAVAAFSPTGLGVATGHDVLQRGLYQAVFTDGVRTFGPATLAAKLAVYASGLNYDVIHTFTVFGDPALRIPTPFDAGATATAASHLTATAREAAQAATATTLAHKTATAFAQTVTAAPAVTGSALAATGTVQAAHTATAAAATATVRAFESATGAAATATAQAVRTATAQAVIATARAEQSATPTPQSSPTPTSTPHIEESRVYLPVVTR